MSWQRLWAATSGWKTHLAGILAALLIANGSGHWIPADYANYLLAAAAALGISGVAHKLDRQRHAVAETAQALAAWGEVFPVPALNALATTLTGLSAPPPPVTVTQSITSPVNQAGIGLGALGEMAERLLPRMTDAAAKNSAENPAGDGATTAKNANISLALTLLLPILLPGADLRGMLASAGEQGVRQLLTAALGKRWEDAAPKIAAAMEKDGKGLRQVDRVAAIRDAQFRLWKAVVKNGTIADGFRDHHAAVVEALAKSPEPVETTLDLVLLVAQAELEQTF